jgi:hypothetical protein
MTLKVPSRGDGNYESLLPSNLRHLRGQHQLGGADLFLFLYAYICKPHLRHLKQLVREVIVENSEECSSSLIWDGF